MTKRHRLRFVHATCVAACLFTVALGLPQVSAATLPDRSLPRVTEYDALLVSSVDSNRVLLGTGHGLFESADGGRSWKPAGLRGEAVSGLAQVGRTILAAGSNLFDASVNGGRTWRRLRPRGLPDEHIEALAAEPGRSSTVYVVLSPLGLFRSTDGARSFNPVSLTIGPAVRAMTLTSTHILLGDVVSGVYVGSNGRVWAHTAGGMVMALAADPRNQKRLLAASFGIALSRDGGRFWTTTMHSRAKFGAVAWAPSRPSLAYAIGDNGSFWRSSDAGLEWARVSIS